jgi:transposase
MRPDGSPEALEARRRLAVARVLEGYGPAEVADILGVAERSVWRWAAAARRDGVAGLAAAPAAGRPPKLTAAQAARVLAWVRRDPRTFGFDTRRWTARRVAAVVEWELGVRFNRRYLSAWLAARGITPQLPQLVPRERDPAAVAAWVARRWPVIKRGRPRSGRRWRSPTRPGS